MNDVAKSLFIRECPAVQEVDTEAFSTPQSKKMSCIKPGLLNRGRQRKRRPFPKQCPHIIMPSTVIHKWMTNGEAVNITQSFITPSGLEKHNTNLLWSALYYVYLNCLPLRCVTTQ